MATRYLDGIDPSAVSDLADERELLTVAEHPECRTVLDDRRRTSGWRA
ncbi:hypothetical protein [Pseudonocardia parietis]|uniref:Uncharacterized protein n=1 Tax=Pseudonocardia parietis TaxID=570936 RepID=A0ABS4VXS6_9PSEU|nr:hypothetical protein [Pseudonocardia parietis]MBP2368743.1 hypothetical protein [Pseudonocardia parietis]